jgi:hypothetical protein
MNGVAEMRFGPRIAELFRLKSLSILMTIRTAALAALVSVLGSASAHANLNYTIDYLALPSTPASDSFVESNINNLNQVVMYTSTSTNSYLYNPFTKASATLPNDPDAQPLTTVFAGLNDTGILVGNYEPTTLGTYQSLASNGSIFLNITPPASLNTDFSAAFGINNLNQVVGTWEVQSDHEQGYLLSGGTYTTINDPGYDTELYGINNSGEIIGVNYPVGPDPVVTGFSYQGGVFTPLTVAGFSNIAPSAINDSGEIVGTVSNSNDNEGPYESFVEIGGVSSLFSISGAVQTAITGVNNAGDLVGDYTDANGSGGSFLAIPTAPDAASSALMMMVALVGVSAFRGLARRTA